MQSGLPSMVAWICNLSSQVLEEGRSEILGHPKIYEALTKGEIGLEENKSKIETK